MLHPNTWIQIPVRFKIGIHKLYLGQTGGVGYLCMLSVTFDLIISLAQVKVEIER